MTAVSIAAQNIRLDDAEATTDWGSIGGGAGGGLETDFKYQGSNCFSRKGATAQRGIFLSDGVDSDLSGAGTYETVLLKFICTTPGLLDLLSVPGMRLEIGSGSTPASPSTNFHFYDVQGSDTYPIDKSWLVLPIDPNIAAHRTGTTGVPDLTVVDYYASRYDQTGVSKSPNQAMDAVDIGAGLTLTGGDGADPDGVWQDFSDADWGTVANRYGYVREIDGATAVFLIFGQMVIGTSAATVFNDSDITLLFPDGFFAAGFSGITIDLQNATTDVDFTDSNFFGKGTAAGEDTRPTFTVTSTSGAFDTSNCVFDSFASMTLTSACSLVGGKISNSGLVSLVGATLDQVEITGSTVGDNNAAILTNDLGDITDCDFTFSDGHAIEIDTTGTFSLAGNTFTGYGADGTSDAAIFNDSGGLVTINITSGTTPTVRNGAGASTVINNAVTIRVEGLTEGAACKCIADETVGTITEGDVIFELLADSNGVAELTTFNYESAFDPSGLDIIIRTAQQGLPNAALQDDNGAFTDFTTAANSTTVDDMVMYPATPVVNQDSFQWGHAEQFARLKLELSTAGAGGFGITWEYWNGTIWTALSGVVDGTSNFTATGEQIVSWTLPGDWATRTDGSLGPFFYVRARFTSGTMSTVPLGRMTQLDVKRYLTSEIKRTVLSTGLTTTASHILDTISKFTANE